MQTNVGYFDHVFQLPGLFFYFGGKKQRSGSDSVTVEPTEGMKHVEPLHVHDRRIDAQLCPEIEMRISLEGLVDKLRLIPYTLSLCPMSWMKFAAC